MFLLNLMQLLEEVVLGSSANLGKIVLFLSLFVVLPQWDTNMCVTRIKYHIHVKKDAIAEIIVYKGYFYQVLIFF